MEVPFAAYADFEALLEPTDNIRQPIPCESYTTQYQMHKPSSFCYFIKCFNDDIYSREPVTFSKENEDNHVCPDMSQ